MCADFEGTAILQDSGLANRRFPCYSLFCNSKRQNGITAKEIQERCN